MNIRYFAFLLFFMPMWLSGQNVITKDNASKSILKLYTNADKCLKKQKYTDAIKKLEKAVGKEPTFIDAHLKLGGIYYDQKKYSKAIESFDSAYSLDSSNNKIIQALALCYENAKIYDKAGEYYQIYLEREDKINDEYAGQLISKISALKFRSSALKNPMDFEPVALPAEINTSQFSEYSPSLTADGRRLFFTRVTGNQEDIFYSEKDSSGQWSKAILLPNLNTLENEGAHTISADGKTILFTYCSDREGGKYRGCNIYAAFKRQGKWTKPAFFDAINSKSWDTQPNISGDGNSVIFVSTRKGGKGKSDLWWSVRNAEGKWTAPKNMGSVINTNMREESPFMHPDGKTLYFKSEGHPGMGSFDLFMSTLNSDGTWTEPINLGYPINTKDHEGALVVALDGETAYYSRGDGSVEFDSKGSDLYSFTLPESRRASPVGFANIQVYDEQTKEPLRAFLVLQASKGSTRNFQTDEEGAALLILPVGENFSLNIDKENYYLHSERFELDTTNTSSTAFEIKVYLRKIAVEIESEPVVLKNVLFESGSYELLAESHFELDNLAKMLDKNRDLKIEIRGHTDDVGDENDNAILSKNRAQEVYDYLVMKGIEEQRLSYKGFGETQPIISNDSEEGRKVNRRTEFVTRK